MNASQVEVKDKMIRKRWTVLDVDNKTIKKVKNYSRKHRVSTGKALDIIVEAFDNESKKESLDNTEVKG